jgi:hypothetical protein
MNPIIRKALGKIQAIRKAMGQIQTIRKALVQIPNYKKSLGPNFKLRFMMKQLTEQSALTPTLL